MSLTPGPVGRLIEELSRLPGIGPKTASRLTFYMLRAPEAQVIALADAIRGLRAGTVLCSTCFNIAEHDPCPICTDQERDRGLICVVEEPLDVLAIERTRRFRGVYHVLHGALSPVDGIGPDELKMRELVERVRSGGVREVLLATNPTMEGDATAMYLARQLAPTGVRVTRLAMGLPVGGDLEYADEVTLGEALEGRRDV
ncbi:MAG: recombination mediator RecR [Anaerolineae bacterium]|nr:recombination mediator RecR [Anaerolineae bacterium]